MRDVKVPTVYLATSRERPLGGIAVERMALSPDLDDEPPYEPSLDEERPTGFPFRVAFRFVNSTMWWKSCRGSDSNGGEAMKGWSDADAIAWLLEGEEPATRSKSKRKRERRHA